MPCYIGLDFIVLAVFMIVSSYLRSGAAQEAITIDNEFCGLRPTLIPVDHPAYGRYPYYVTLHRCGGSDGFVSPRFRSCVPATEQRVRIQVRNLNNGEFENVEESNHTSCKAGCTNNRKMCDTEMEEWDERNCRCECKYTNGPPNGCPARFRWNSYMCQCECDEERHATECISEVKLWSRDECGCKCSPRVVARCKRLGLVVDEEVCRCVAGEVVFGAHVGKAEVANVSKKVLVGIVFGELFLLLLVFDLILYVKKWGFIYYLRKSLGKAVSQDSHKSPPLSPSSNHDRTTYL